jgi:hypothetical protein
MKNGPRPIDFSAPAQQLVGQCVQLVRNNVDPEIARFRATEKELVDRVDAALAELIATQHRLEAKVEAAISQMRAWQTTIKNGERGPVGPRGEKGDHGDPPNHDVVLKLIKEVLAPYLAPFAEYSALLLERQRLAVEQQMLNREIGQLKVNGHARDEDKARPLVEKHEELAKEDNLLSVRIREARERLYVP